MSLKSLFRILCLLVVFSLCNSFYYNDGIKARSQRIQDYGERLSSVEDEGILKIGPKSILSSYKGKPEDKSSKQTTVGNNATDTATTKRIRCTTDREIIIGTYKPNSDNEKNTKSEEDEKVLQETETSTQKVPEPNVYVPPKKDKLPDHYIDDV